MKKKKKGRKQGRAAAPASPGFQPLGGERQRGRVRQRAFPAQRGRDSQSFSYFPRLSTVGLRPPLTCSKNKINPSSARDGATEQSLSKNRNQEIRTALLYAPVGNPPHARSFPLSGPLSSLLSLSPPDWGLSTGVTSSSPSTEQGGTLPAGHAPMLSGVGGGPTLLCGCHISLPPAPYSEGERLPRDTGPGGTAFPWAFPARCST